MTKYTDILEGCIKIAKERGENYGSVEDNLRDTSNILQELYGVALEPYQIAEVFIATKFSRNKFKEKDDNTVDVLNYIAIRKYLLDKEEG